MKGLQKFIHTHKKGCLITGGIILALLIILFTIFFIAPALKNNNYGDRLQGIENHKVSQSTINTIKQKLKNENGVTKVTYNIEGRILNFTVETDGSIDYESAKAYTKDITDNISSKNKKYYDIQIFLTSKENKEGFPNAGYKSKSSEDFSWGNVGETNE